MKTRKLIIGAVLATATVCSAGFATTAAADNLPLNAAIGAGAGALLGSSVGGRNGALLGGLLGAAAGVAISSQHRQGVAYAPYGNYPPAAVGYAPPPVAYGPPPMVYAPQQVMYQQGPVYAAPQMLEYGYYRHHPHQGWDHRHWRR